MLACTVWKAQQNFELKVALSMLSGAYMVRETSSSYRVVLLCA